jgi:hypothetical protein
VQTWVIPTQAVRVNWFQRVFSGVPLRRSYLEFDVLPAELHVPGGVKGMFPGSQGVIPGTVNLTGRNVQWGTLPFDVGLPGFTVQATATAARRATVKQNE